MTSLFSDLIPRKRKQCKVGKLYAALSEADAEILRAAVEGDDFGMRYLAQELTKRGMPISETPLYQHKKKSCGCYMEKLN